MTDAMDSENRRRLSELEQELPTMRTKVQEIQTQVQGSTLSQKDSLIERVGILEERATTIRNNQIAIETTRQNEKEQQQRDQQERDRKETNRNRLYVTLMGSMITGILGLFGVVLTIAFGG